MGRIRAFLGSGLLVSLPLACGAPMVQMQAAKDFGCTEEQISAEHIGDAVYKAEGCGKKDVYGFLMSTGSFVSLVERASFELSCERTDLTITPLAPRQMGVSGCGAKRVYVLVDAGWVLDSGASQAAPPAPTPPTPPASAVAPAPAPTDSPAPSAPSPGE
jgi:hypothetical protein